LIVFRVKIQENKKNKIDTKTKNHTQMDMIFLFCPKNAFVFLKSNNKVYAC